MVSICSSLFFTVLSVLLYIQYCHAQADQFTSGTILQPYGGGLGYSRFNAFGFFGRKKRQADQFTSGTILQPLGGALGYGGFNGYSGFGFFGRKKRQADQFTSGTIYSLWVGLWATEVSMATMDLVTLAKDVKLDYCVVN
uniref:Uncharacterized protein n=1 Tax=Ditylenchus dipsaci TaxID=166011 RepID=A0A915E630_9BILA